MQHRMGNGDLLDGQGRLIERGWASAEVRRYDRKAIRASGWRIKEWDYYCITTDSHALALTVADNGPGLTPDAGHRLFQPFERLDAERQGISAESWNAMPSSWFLRSSAGDLPSTVTYPAVAVSRPARMRRIVDLPQPEGPSSDRNEPRSLCRFAFSSAVSVSRPILNFLVSPEMVMPLPSSGERAAASFKFMNLDYFRSSGCSA